MMADKLKISHTVFPNGHKCNWKLVDVNKLFFWATDGNYWFAWARDFKNKPKSTN